MPKTMFDKIWDAHVVQAEQGKPAILYIDLHLVHEVTSAQAFDGLRMAGRKVHRPELTVATMDHNVPTTDRSAPDSIRHARPGTDHAGACYSGFRANGVSRSLTAPP